MLCNGSCRPFNYYSDCVMDILDLLINHIIIVIIMRIYLLLYLFDTCNKIDILDILINHVV
jgi:hypothetical protein